MSGEVLNKLRLFDEPIPHERHGEMGYLWSPKTPMTMDDLMLYARVSQAWGDRDLETRDNVVKLVEEVAKQTVPNSRRRKRMIKTVVAYLDEQHDMALRMAPSAGSA